jgi:V/A-type H+-transporting ATPase subunit I
MNDATIILAAMAVIVHGVRLNMLEFCGHVGNTWSGFKYKPLKFECKKEI